MNGRNKKITNASSVQSFASNWAFSAWGGCAEKKEQQQRREAHKFRQAFFFIRFFFKKRAPTRLVLFFFLSFLLRPRKVESELKPPTEEEEADWLQTILPPGESTERHGARPKKREKKITSLVLDLNGASCQSFCAKAIVA